MRTTVAIRDDLHEAVRQLAFDERRTLGDVINDLIEQGLTARRGNGRTLGQFVGQIHIADDFDDPLPDMDAALDSPVGP